MSPDLQKFMGRFFIVRLIIDNICTNNVNITLSLNFIYLHENKYFDI